MHKVGETGVTVLAMIGTFKVVCWANQLMVKALVVFGKWDPEAAASASPWVLFALVSGLAMSLYGLYEENEQYKRSSPYDSVQHSERRSDNGRKAG